MILQFRIPRHPTSFGGQMVGQLTYDIFAFRGPFTKRIYISPCQVSHEPHPEADRSLYNDTLDRPSMMSTSRSPEARYRPIHSSTHPATLPTTRSKSVIRKVQFEVGIPRYAKGIDSSLQFIVCVALNWSSRSPPQDNGFTFFKIYLETRHCHEKELDINKLQRWVLNKD